MKFPIDPPHIHTRDVLDVVDDFRKFAFRQNLVDMAIGIIIGSAFSKIVSSLVKDIIMPPLGILIGGINLNTFSIVLKKAVKNDSGVITQRAVTLNIGSFAQTIFDFSIVALSLYVAVRVLLSIQNGRICCAAPQEKLSRQEELLTEIKNLLKNSQNNAHQ